ncbi:molybdopterin dinucleotide binding domain-containing protein [Bacillus sp. JJ1562]|uniref:molybdopterin dinucleotide binding domain-containing protein n=1 Tax=Bacillus sp. JJ1562 TaxID=3122960 RepID=UPI0030013076
MDNVINLNDNCHLGSSIWLRLSFFHTMFTDTKNMVQLFRGWQVVWLYEDDAAEIGIKDNDWIELYNRIGAVVARAVLTYNGKEIVDYIPMLFELLAHAPEGENFERLYRRLAFAVDRIHKNLIDSNPYNGILDLLMMFVFEAPEAEEITLLENQREEADLEELPYPMLYK